MKSPSRLPREQVNALRPGDVKQYLTSRGWRPQGDADLPKAVTLRHPDHAGVELVVPMERSLGDYVLRMADVVVAIARIEDRPVDQVLNDLATPPGDVFRFRVVGSVATLGNLPLDEAIQLIGGGRQLLWASAYSTIQPQPLLPQRTLKQVDDFLKSCRMGQTERGSFVATIITPVPPEIQQTLGFDDADLQEEIEPFPRRVTTRLMESLGLVAGAIRSGETGRILEGVNQGVSANLCETLAAMKPPGDESRLDIKVTWARSRSHLPAGVPETVSFPKEDFDIIAEAGRQLRVRAVARRETYIGKVGNVKRTARPLFPGICGWMVMATEVGGVPARVKVDLNSDEFAQACDALRDEQRVAVTGIIRQETKAREFVLSEPRDFRVLGEP
ncbi:hypothetical protein [Tautonia plasticadhaerens]|uniref:Uncharacterized protein n=1 Tax=Tautonia plasticadhaerens TaxID=2527974 RepID=A0A518GYN1_9BACT|nr:hypothetical protein [Tautonia plasticadhaerens]QDV33710.1 hypothetical protein ElP_15870 [Tautonia plasticadhaerens]